MDFKHVRKGFQPEEVDSFLNYLRENWSAGNISHLEKEIRFKKFEIVKGGYSTDEVGRALYEIERSSAKRNKSNSVSIVGNQLFIEQIRKQLSNLWISKKSPKKNFTLGKNAEKTYKIKQVDKYIDQLKKSFNHPQIKITKNGPKSKTFNTVKGQKGYKMKEVDEFLDQVTSLYNALTV